MGREQSVPLSVAVSSGSGTGTFANSWDIIRRLRVCPPNETTTYTVTIKDAGGYVVVPATDFTGTLPLADLSLGIIKTIEITNSSADGTFHIFADLH